MQKQQDVLENSPVSNLAPFLKKRNTILQNKFRSFADNNLILLDFLLPLKFFQPSQHDKVQSLTES